MKVSVIIPTHNRPNQLDRAYYSLCQQTRKPEEIIIIDDGSQTPVNLESQKLLCVGTKTLIKRNQNSLGACQARNIGAAIATGDILMFLDDDDTWEIDKIAAQLLIFQHNPAIGLVYSGRLVVKENNCVQSKGKTHIIYKILPKAEGNLYPQILYSNLIGTTSSVAILKSLFEEVQGFDSKLSGLQDHDLWIRACQKTFVAHDNACNVKYTISLKSDHQISSCSESYTKAVNQILKKYSSEIALQGNIGKRKIYSSFYFFAAKSCRFRGIIPAIPWIIRSLREYPNLKAIVLFLPLYLIHLLQKIGSKFNYFTKSQVYTSNNPKLKMQSY